MLKGATGPRTMLLAATPAAVASFHLFQIEQLYSNADRSVQFIVMHQSPSANGENLWEGRQLTSTSPGSAAQTFTFPADLPSSATADRRELSYGFTDGSGHTGTIPLTRLTQNVTCSTTSSRPTNADFALSGNWYDPATSGQGFTVDVNPNSGTVFSAWYTYAPNGQAEGPAGQRWFSGESAQTAFAPGQRAFDLTLYETVGGLFDELRSGARRVCESDPPAGSTVDPGSSVTLKTAKRC